MNRKLAGKTHPEVNSPTLLTRKLQDDGDAEAWSEETVQADVVASMDAKTLHNSVMKHANKDLMAYKGNLAGTSEIARHETYKYRRERKLNGVGEQAAAL